MDVHATSPLGVTVEVNLTSCPRGVREFDLYKPPCMIELHLHNLTYFLRKISTQLPNRNQIITIMDPVSEQKNTGNVIGGHKANLHNPSQCFPQINHFLPFILQLLMCLANRHLCRIERAL